ncbi:MAG: threonine synthase [Pyrinomonadaceae bacterium]
MRYFSTNRQAPDATFRKAMLAGQPADKGLYFPAEIPQIKRGFIDCLPELADAEIAFEVIKPYVADEIDDRALAEICRETVDLEFPLVEITDRISSLELFHGPTLAFKDVGARFMSRCLRYFAERRGEETIVLVATSGDTGGAVAAGFHGVDGVEVVILYPKGRVSRVQELQLTTLGGNVTAVGVHGAFDDCQALAKAALADREITGRVRLTSANSINIARWLPQQFYYFFALKQWTHGEPPVVSVPSGNFGNIASGILAHASGLPVERFIAACNANDVVPRFLLTGRYDTRPSVATLSNAMDVGSPSNFVRIRELLGDEPAKILETLEAASISDEETIRTIREVHAASGYTLDPHGAVGYRALADHLDKHPGKRGLFLETAHPIKFDSVEQILGAPVEVPASIAALDARDERSIEIDPDHELVKQILLSKI